MLRTPLAFFKKDLLINMSYKFNFILSFVGIFMSVTILYFLGSLVDAAENPLLKQYGGNYFGFLMIGIAFADYTKISINNFAGNIRDGQVTGTLEIILTSPTPIIEFLLSSSLWSYFFTTFRLMVYGLFGVFFYNLDIGNANVPAAMLILALSIVCYMAIGIIAAALILLVKRGEGAINFMGGIFFILGGLIFPVEVMPEMVRNLTDFIPFKYSLHGMRVAILEGSTLAALREDFVALSLFAALFILLSTLIFPFALRKAKENGSLTQY